MASTSSVDPCGLHGSLVVPKGKTSPNKRDAITHLKPQVEVVVSNNEEDTKQQQRKSNVRQQRDRELAAMLLQRQVQVWLLRRQETLHAQEVQRLRGDLRKAAICVIEESYARYAKRRAIHNYLQEIGTFETRLDELLQRCVTRKRQIEEIKRFDTLRRQQKQQEENRKHTLVHDWLRLCIQSRHMKKEHTAAKAREKLLGCVRRWMLRKRCEARAAVRERGQQLESQRFRSSALRITEVYRAHRLCQEAKRIARNRRRMRDGLMKLDSAIHLAILRVASSRWYSQIRELNIAHKSAITLQRVCRGHQTRIRNGRVVRSCLQLQRVIRGWQARMICVRLKRRKLEEILSSQSHAAATIIQRHARGYLTRLWFRDVLIKLRERFCCANCGALEPGGRYCKYCGRHRPSLGSLSNVLMLHEKWQIRRLSQDQPILVHGPTDVQTIPSPKKPTLLGCGSVDPLTSLPSVLSPRHRRLIARNSGPIAQPTSLAKANIRRKSVASISEQTALRAMAIADLQAKFTSSTQVNVLEMHFRRLQRANAAIYR
ncbi:hypothetical protein AM587_10014037 [Phytophthora nicotianae]|uniref:Uncharacterized protein n=1 Tax=Phytophthora nicotianae TaxID=4792 RepID=A0A0W8CLP0_PHYNI|nr:hypothetical protein AM587_10014037 [Phytophthora nicotianae]